MKPEKKARSDSKLKNLPAERQEQILELFSGRSLQEVRDELRNDGLHTSVTALSEFYSWFQLQQQFKEDESTAEDLLEQLKREVPEITDEQLDLIGQRTFSLLAIRRQDPETFLKVRSARFKGEIEKAKLDLRERAEARHREALVLERQRFQRETCDLFLKWFEDQRAKEISTSGESNASKIERLGQLMFGADWN